jgi:hypothetical protein
LGGNPGRVRLVSIPSPRVAAPAPLASRALEALLNVRPLRRRLALTLLLVVVTAATAAATAGVPARPGKRPAAATRAPADTATRQALIVEGDDHLFLVAAPRGWVLDDTSGMGSRIRCVFYPHGQTWASAATVMYVNPLHGYGARTRTVSALIAEDEKEFLKRTPRGKVVPAPGMVTAGKKTAIVRYFSDDGGPPHEAVAYVPEKDLIMLVVLSSHTPGGFQQALGAYQSLVESYAWIGSKRELGR